MAMTIDEQMEVMDAFKHGASIQFKESGSENWEDTNTPIWNFSQYEYRVRTVNSNTRVLDVTNIKQFFEEYKGDKVADANNILDQILPVLTPASYDHIVKWLEDNTQHIESNEYIKQTDVTYEYLKENDPDLIQEILNTEEADPGNMTDDEVENCVRYWMNRASYDEIVRMIKDEA